MFRPDGIKKVFDKLKDKKAEGTLTVELRGRKEKRVTYELDGVEVFTFGMTRSSAAKEIPLRYIPRHMLIQNAQYRDLHDCPWGKSDFNKHLRNIGATNKEK